MKDKVRFDLKNYRFEIIEQDHKWPEYAVKIYRKHDGVIEATDYFWLREPSSRYETISGACYAILLFLEKQDYLK